MVYKMTKKLFYLVHMGFLLVLWGCSPVGVVSTVGSSAGVMLLEERQVKHSIADLKMKANIVKELATLNAQNLVQINVDSFEAIILLTGHVPSLTQRQQAVKVAYQQPGVLRVINEIKIKPTIDFTQFSKDEWVNLQIQTRLTFDSNINAVNYISRTVAGHVYFLGIAQTEEEQELVSLHARETPNVRAISMFTRLVNDPERLDWLEKVKMNTTQ